SDGLPLAAINDGSDAGKALLASARQMLINLGKPTETVLDVADTKDTVKLFANTVFNGDGVIVPETATDADTRQLILDIIAQHQSVPDRSGKQGIDKPRADAFFAECDAYAAWWADGAAARFQGDATATAYAA